MTAIVLGSSVTFRGRLPRIARTARWAAVAIVLLSFAGGGAMGAEASSSNASQAEAQLLSLYLGVLESAVDHFEPLWCEVEAPPNGGFFDVRRYGAWWPKGYDTVIAVPCNGMVALSYAVLLTRTDRPCFGRRKVPRAVILRHCRQAIRWCCLTSAYVDNPCPYLPDTRADLASGRQWKRPPGYRADLIGYLSVAATLMWQQLDEETREAFVQTAAGTALRERIGRYYTRPNGGNHDQIKHDLSSTVAAAYLLGHHPDHHKFMDVVRAAGIDMVATRHDLANRAVVHQRPVAEWAGGWNLFDDYSSDHHGRASVWYGGDMLFEGWAYVDILSRLAGTQPPETYTYADNGFDGVCRWMMTLALDTGALMHPHGAEYDSYYGAGLLAFAYGGCVRRDPVAAALETQAARLLERHTAAVRRYDYHRGSWAKAAMAYLLHAFHPGGPYAFPLSEALVRLEGVRHFHDQRCVVHRTPDRWCSFSWGSRTCQDGQGRPAFHYLPGPCGLIAPSGVGKPLVYSHPNSLAGVFVRHDTSAARTIWVAVLAALFVFGAGLVGRAGGPVGPMAAAAVAGAAMAGLCSAWLAGGLVPDRTPLLARLARWPILVPSGVTAAALCVAAVTARGRKTIDGPVLWGSAFAWPAAVGAGVIWASSLQPLQECRNAPGVFASAAVHAGVATLAAVVLSAVLLLKITRRLAGIALSSAAVCVLAFFCVSLWCLAGGVNGPACLHVLFRQGGLRPGWPRNVLAMVALATLGGAVLIQVLLRRRHLSAVLLMIGLAVTAASFVFPVGVEPIQFDVEHAWRLRDDGFSTGGRLRSPEMMRHQAFFSFAGGPAITMVAAVARTHCTVSWSGLPVYFFERGALTDRRRHTRGPHGEPGRCTWWSVDDALAMGVTRSLPDRLSRGVGFNWAVTPAYRDACSMKAVSPLDKRTFSPGQSIVDFSASVWTGEAARNCSNVSHEMEDLSGCLPNGWRAVAAPSGQGDGRRAIAVANFSGKEDTAVLRLSFDEGAAVFERDTTVTGTQGAIALHLKPLQTWGQMVELYIVSQPNQPVIARQQAPGRFVIRPKQAEATSVRLRYRGPKANAVRILRLDGTPLGTQPVAQVASRDGALLRLAGRPVLVEVESARRDTVGPAVEIARIEGTADELLIGVNADDRSGASVGLYCDGRLVGRRQTPPFQWRMKVSPGWHTFHASATDDSPAGNTSRSFRRTVRISEQGVAP